MEEYGITTLTRNALIRTINNAFELGSYDGDLSYELQATIVREFEDDLDWYGLEKVSDDITPTEQLLEYKKQLEKGVI